MNFKPILFSNLNVDSICHIFDLWNIYHPEGASLFSRYSLVDTAVGLNMDFNAHIERNRKYNNITLKSLLLK